MCLWSYRTALPGERKGTLDFLKSAVCSSKKTCITAVAYWNPLPFNSEKFLNSLGGEESGEMGDLGGHRDATMRGKDLPEVRQ